MEVIEKDKEKEGHEHDGGQTVKVTVDGKDFSVRRGSYVVSAFKAVVGVAASQELDQVVAGEFKVLPDDSEIRIKGGEQFVSHGRGGGSG